MTGTTKDLVLGPFTPGMNTRRPDFKLQETVDGIRAAFVRSAVNADISSEGTIKRRGGYEPALPGTDCHSLWSDGVTGFYVDGTTLYQVTGNAGAPTKTALRTDMTAGKHVSYAIVNDSVVYSNGVVIGRVDAAGNHAHGVTPLLREPGVVGLSGGSLPEGDYALCFTLSDANGEESGSTTPIQVTVPKDGSVLISGMPSVFPAGVVALNIYMTSTNDSTLMRIGAVLTPQTSMYVSSLQQRGSRCQTLMMRPMPPGQIVRELNGRLLVASGVFLFYSEPFGHALYNPARNYVQFPAEITMVEPCQNGFYIAADQTYWVAGDIATAELLQVLPYGAVPQSSGPNPESNTVLWMGARGMVEGSQTGEVTQLQEDNVAVDPARTGAFLYRKQDGLQQALGALFGTEPTGIAASSFIEAEVIRKANPL